MRLTTRLLATLAALGVASGAQAAGNPGSSVAAGAPTAPSEQAMPAAPSEQAIPAAPAPQSAVAGEAAPARQSAPELGPVGYDEQGRPGRIHVVVPGDTLWDISEAYLGTPWVWPAVWRDNPEVANPHRIWPGDRIWITPTEMRRLSAEEAAQYLARRPGDAVPASADEGAGLGDAMARSTSKRPVPGLRSFGYVTREQIEGAGSILASPRQGKLLGQPDRIYVSLGQGQVSPGDQFTVVRATDSITDPETGKEIGVFVDTLGWLEVTDVDRESSEARIRMSYAEIERGDRILPRVKMPEEVAVHPASSDVEGQIAYFPGSRTVSAGEDVVYLNRGTDHGVDVGIPLEVYRTSGKVRDKLTKERYELPDDVVAKLLVVSAEPTTSVAVVTQSHVELARGDHFRSAKP
jgi:hypothetical protein